MGLREGEGGRERERIVGYLASYQCAKCMVGTGGEREREGRGCRKWGGGGKFGMVFSEVL